MIPVVIIWGAFGLLSIWWGVHDGDWSTARFVWGLFGAIVVAAWLREWWERRSAHRARERAITLHMAEELAVLRLIDYGAIDQPPTWAVVILKTAARVANERAAEVFGADETDDEYVTAWHRRTEHDLRVALVRERAAKVYPTSETIGSSY
ncbi:hypothetical protein [Cellulomonas sp. P5_E12]